MIGGPVTRTETAERALRSLIADHPDYRTRSRAFHHLDALLRQAQAKDAASLDDVANLIATAAQALWNLIDQSAEEAPADYRLALRNLQRAEEDVRALAALDAEDA